MMHRYAKSTELSGVKSFRFRVAARVLIKNHSLLRPHFYSKVFLQPERFAKAPKLVGVAFALFAKAMTKFFGRSRSVCYAALSLIFWTLRNSTFCSACQRS